MLRRLLPEGVATLWRDPTGSLVLAELSCCDDWLGEKVSALEAAADTRIVFISRLGEALLPGPGTVLQQGDVLHVMAKESDLKQITAAFARRGAPGKGGHV
jgi:trk system potassium uptake protein TrkA